MATYAVIKAVCRVYGANSSVNTDVVFTSDQYEKACNFAENDARQTQANEAQKLTDNGFWYAEAQLTEPDQDQKDTWCVSVVYDEHLRVIHSWKIAAIRLQE